MDTDSDVSDNDQTHLLNVLNDADANSHVHTAFDAYFVHAASRSRTSTNVFSARVLPLTQQEYNDTITAYDARTADAQPRTRWSGNHDGRTAFRRYAHELDQGFNLVFYGFGSKRAILDDFASQELAHRGHVVVVNGYHPNTTLRDVLASIERVPGLANTAATGADAQVRRICSFFSAVDAPRTRHLYLVVHNIDAPPMRTLKMRNTLSLLALSPNIHLVTSVDRLGAPLLWSTSELLARKLSPGETPASFVEGHTASPKRGYAFLWHDLTTLTPYDTELSFADRSSITGASYASTGARSALATASTAGAGVPLTETAVAHVLAAVTSKAKKLFILLGTRQLENVEAASGAITGGEATAPTDMAQFGLGYDALFSLAREHFVATSDTALRALLGEFKDHGLIVTGAVGGGGGGAGGDTLWIPLRNERLLRVLKSIEAESSQIVI